MKWTWYHFFSHLKEEVMFLSFLWTLGVKVHHLILTTWWIINYKWVIFVSLFIDTAWCDIKASKREAPEIGWLLLVKRDHIWYVNHLTWTRKTNLRSKNYQQWNNSMFLVRVSLPIQTLKYLSNIISRILPTKTTSEMHYISPKLRDCVVVK